MKLRSGRHRDWDGCLLGVWGDIREIIISSNIPVSYLTVNKVRGLLRPEMERYSEYRYSTLSKIIKRVLDKLLRDQRHERKKWAGMSGGGSKSRGNDSGGCIVTADSAEGKALLRRRAAGNASKDSNTAVSNDSSTPSPTLGFEISDRAHKLLQPPVDVPFQEMNGELLPVLL